MRLLDGRRIRILNKDNLDCIIDFDTAKLLSYVKVDNLHRSNFDAHFFAARNKLAIGEVGQRLIRKA